jgi:hypothetical protein
MLAPGGYAIQSTGISIGRLVLQRGQRCSEVNCVLASARRNLQHQTVRRQARPQDLQNGIAVSGRGGGRTRGGRQQIGHADNLKASAARRQ